MVKKWTCALVLGASVFATGCELTSTTIAERINEIIVESFVVVGLDPSGRATAYTFVHNTDDAQPTPTIVSVTMTPTGGAPLEIVGPLTPDACSLQFESLPPSFTEGYCFQRLLPDDVQPGTTLQLTVVTADGRTAQGVTTIPDDFTFVAPAQAGRTCRIPPDERVDVMWTSSPGAWAYPSETRITGLRDALTAIDSTFAQLVEPVELFGLAISAADTVISFPNEFGLFDRFDDSDVFTRSLVQIQDGLPEGGRAQVTVAAADRNYVNWERGGNFNPSGLVRVPSVRGDGFGVFGSMVLRTLAIEVGEPEAGREACVR